MARVQAERRSKEEDGRKSSATIVVATTSCGTVRRGRKSRRNFVLPREKSSPAPFAIRTCHRDGTPRQTVEDREGCDRGMSQHDIDDKGDYRVGIKTGETGGLQVKLLRGNAVLPARGSAGAAGYDLCAASNCVIPSRGKGTIETGLVVSLPPGTYVRIAPRSGLAIRNFINVGGRE